MSELDKMLAFDLHDPNEKELASLHRKTQEYLYEYNLTKPAEEEKRQEILQQVLGSCPKKITMKPPIYIDYGFRTKIGEFFFSNYHVTMLDTGGITIGDHVFLGPNVSLYSVAHPMDQETRNTELEYGKPIVIKDNVWLGGSVTVLGGVTIHENCVIGAGSVVVKDIPPNSFAAGNPCKVIRTLQKEKKR